MGQSSVLKGASILVVEEDVTQLLELVDILGEAGAASVVPAFGLREASQALEDCTFDGAIMDYRIGSSTTAEIAEQLCRRNTPFIIRTVNGHSERFPEHWARYKLIPKPTDPDQLIQSVAEQIFSDGIASPAQGRSPATPSTL